MGLFKRYYKEQDGVAAVEFALLATPIMLTMLGLIELCLFYASGIAVEGAATSAARVIRTGQAQDSGDAMTAFEDRLCSQVGVFVDCNNLVYESVNVGDSFMDADMEPQYDEDGNMISQGFDAGDAEDVILVRVAYRHEFLTPYLGGMLGDGTQTDSSVHVSTVVIKNEPFSFGG